MRAARNIPDIPVDFGFTEEHGLLRQTARRVLEKGCPLSEVRRLADDERGYSPELMNEIAELGWCGLILPEEHGGAELDHLSMALLLEETGRCLLPGPFFPTVLAGIAVAELGNDEERARMLPALATGKSWATVGMTEGPGTWEPFVIEATATLEGRQTFRLDGFKSHVMWARAADQMIGLFRHEGRVIPVVVPLDAEGVTVEPEVSVDSTRRMDRVIMDGVRVPTSARLAAGSVAWRRFLVRALGLMSAEMLGAAQKVLLITRDYALERVQFNRPIGAFQAVKHPLVNALIAIEKARSLTYGAAATLGYDRDRAEVHSRAAKAAAEEALSFAADRGIQFHGGFGFTWDCDAHFFLKRAIWSAATLGDAIHHRRWIAHALFD